MIVIKYKLFEKLNSRGSKSLTEEEFNQILKTSCKNWTKSKTPLYRGQIDMGPYVYFDPKGTYRQSIEDINIHIDLIDNLPSWNEYPKYSSSVIGSTSNNVSNYGKVYEIIPFDNINIGVCPKTNIWDSFGYTKFGEWGEDIYKVYHFLTTVGIDANMIYINDSNNLEKNLQSINKIDISKCDYSIKEYANQFLIEASEFFGKKIKDLNGSDCYKFINDKFFNPKERGFINIRYDIGFNLPINRQIWTNGPVLLIDAKLS
jgi:hypothetical protein